VTGPAGERLRHALRKDLGLAGDRIVRAGGQAVRFPLGEVAFEQVPQRDGSVLLRPGVGDVVTVRDLAGNQRLIWSAESGGSSSSSASSDSEGDLNGWVDMPDFNIVYADGTTRKQVRLTPAGLLQRPLVRGARRRRRADDKCGDPGRSRRGGVGRRDGAVPGRDLQRQLEAVARRREGRDVARSAAAGDVRFAVEHGRARLHRSDRRRAAVDGVLAGRAGENLWFTWTDITYADKLVSTGHSATGGDTSYITFRGCRFGQKGGASIGAADLVHLKQCIVVSFYDCVFARGGRGIVGRDPNTTYANVVGVYSCTFNKIDSPIYNPGEGWTVENNTFEPNAAGQAAAVNTSGPGDNFCRGFNYIGNWHGDVSATGGNWINGIKTARRQDRRQLFRGHQGRRDSGPGRGRDAGPVDQRQPDGRRRHRSQLHGRRAPGVDRRQRLPDHDPDHGPQRRHRRPEGVGRRRGGGRVGRDDGPARDAGDVPGDRHDRDLDDHGRLEGPRSVAAVHRQHVTVTNGANLKLAGAANFSATADDMLSSTHDGSTWREVSRSVN
jgi:hypothetical protein